MKSKVMEFKHCIVEGTAYEAGEQLGNLLKADKAFIQEMTTPLFGGSKLSKDQIARVKELYDKFCPGTNEEMKGFADAIGANVDDVVYYFAFLQHRIGNCSHIALTPSITEKGHTYLGRNYDYSWEDKPILIETRIKGQYNQIGFGCQVFGRFDGMNEHGLCITTSSGVINPNYKEEGFVFPVIVRALLNNCKTVKEAIKVFDSMKVADYRNFMIIDRNGDAALIEAAASKYAIKRAGDTYEDKYLFSTNHYNIPDMIKLGYPRVRHSITRYKAINAHIETVLPKVSITELKNILSTTMPDGVCCHHYKDGMGTLWSIVFDSMETEANICFGSPSVNQWKTFHINNPVGINKFTAILPNESTYPDFWKQVSNHIPNR